MKSTRHDVRGESQDSLGSDDNAVLEDDIPFEVTPEVPYEDRCCDICNRPLRELKPYDGPENAKFGFIAGAKLFKNFRWDAPHHVSSTRECLDCFGRPEPIWVILEAESRLGRRLTFAELNRLRREWNLAVHDFGLESILEAYDAKIKQVREQSGGHLSDAEIQKIQREFNLVENCPEGGLQALELDHSPSRE